MTEKQTRVLSLLATGIAIELILMVAYVVGRGHSERLLSTRNQGYAVGDNSYQNGSAGMSSGDLQMLYPEGAPITDEDHVAGYDPSYFEETPPVFPGMEDAIPGGADPFAGEVFGMEGLSYGGVPYEGNPFGDSGAYPAPVYGNPGDYGNVGDYSLPTLPPGPLDLLPTDVPAQAGTPTVAVPSPTVAAPTLAVPSPTVAVPSPTVALPSPTLPAPTATQPFTPLPTGDPTDPYQPTATQPAPTATSPAATPPPAATSTPVPPSATPAPSNLGGLAAVPLDEAPVVDGSSADAAWADAPSLSVSTAGGANQSATRVTIQAVYDDQQVYFLLRWDDPTRSFLYYPWEKQADGSWAQRASAGNSETDENSFFEDQLALFWNGGTSADPMLDLWQWQSVRGDGQADDRHLADAQFRPDLGILSFDPDPSQSGGPVANRTSNQKLPVYMPPNGGDRSGAPGYIRDAEKVPFDDSLFKTGERVPFVITAPWQGDRGEVQTAARYQNGAWTLEVRRALETGSQYDVQFDDLAKLYTFGLATFDNTQSRPAMHNETIPFRFVE